MSLMEKEMYEFGPFSLDLAERAISRDGTPLPLTPKVFDTLVCLVRNRGRLLTKDELLKEIWPDTFVEEVNLAVNISTLRKAFGENPQDGRYIVTVPGRGYRFVAEVREVFNADKAELNPGMGSHGESQLRPEWAKPNGVGTRYQSVSETPTHPLPLRHKLERGRAKTNGARKLATPAFVSRGRALKRATLAVLIFLALAVAGGYLRFVQHRRIAPASSTVSIAVLPFADLSPGKDQEYFSDGLAEELINYLAKVPSVRVVARSSSFQFKGKNEDLRVVGKKLGVANILEGSVQRDGDRIRIMAELIKVDDGFQLWSDTYDRQIDDLLSVQDEIARAATGALQVKLLGLDGASLSARARSTNPKAYQVYLQGQYLYGRGEDRESLDKALAYANEAIKLDAKYAPAWALRSYVHNLMAGFGLMENAEGMHKAREDADRAIALDPNLATGYLALGDIQLSYDWDWEGADVLRFQSLAYECLGRPREAIETEKLAVAIDPLRASSYTSLGSQFYEVGQYEEAQATLQKGLELNPQKEHDHYILGGILLATGRPQQALTEMEQDPRKFWRLLGKALTYHALNRPGDSEAALQEIIATDQNGAAFQIAEVYAYRGESDKAFEWLDRAYQQHDGGLTFVKVDPLLRGLRQDARYTELLKKMHLPT